MKRILGLILTFFLCSTASFVTPCFSQETNQAILIGDQLYSDVYEDGKMTGEKIIANPLITNVNGKMQIFWSHIYITPFHDQKDVCLKIERFSSDEGTIRDFRLNKDHTATFQIAPGPYVADSSSERNINVWLKLSEDNKSIVDVSCNMAFWSNILNKKILKEWKQAKEPRFELPYKTVF